MCQRSDDETRLAFADRRLLQKALEADRRNGRVGRLAVAFSLDAMNRDITNSLHRSPKMMKEVE